MTPEALKAARAVAYRKLIDAIAHLRVCREEISVLLIADLPSVSEDESSEDHLTNLSVCNDLRGAFWHLDRALGSTQAAQKGGPP